MAVDWAVVKELTVDVDCIDDRAERDVAIWYGIVTDVCARMADVADSLRVSRAAGDLP